MADEVNGMQEQGDLRSTQRRPWAAPVIQSYSAVDITKTGGILNTDQTFPVNSSS